MKIEALSNSTKLLQSMCITLPVYRISWTLHWPLLVTLHISSFNIERLLRNCKPFARTESRGTQPIKCRNSTPMSTNTQETYGRLYWFDNDTILSVISDNRLHLTVISSRRCISQTYHKHLLLRCKQSDKITLHWRLIEVLPLFISWAALARICSRRWLTERQHLLRNHCIDRLSSGPCWIGGR